MEVHLNARAAQFEIRCSLLRVTADTDSGTMQSHIVVVLNCCECPDDLQQCGCGERRVHTLLNAFKLLNDARGWIICSHAYHLR